MAKKSRVWLAAVAFALVAAGFRAMFLNHLPGAFLAPEEDMDYAWFVPAFSLAVLYLRRDAIVAAAGRPDPAGLILLVPSLAIGYIGARGLQLRFELLAFIGICISVPWIFFGGKLAKEVAFPALCLLFCMPMASSLSVFTVHLRLVASSAAGAVLKVLDPSAIREGNMITLPDVVAADGSPFAIDVANPCSGLRSVVALAALSVMYGYFTQPTLLRRAVLAAVSVPIAVLGNIARILSICLVAETGDAAFAMGFYHDFSGFVVFAVAVLLMLGAGGLIDRCAAARARRRGGGSAAEASGGPSPSSAPARAERSSASGGWAVAAALVLVASTMALQVFAPQPVLAEAPEVRFPRIDGFAARAMEPTEAETTILAGAKVEKAFYESPRGEWFQITAVTSSESKNSMHRPELCLPSQGFDMTEGETVEIEGRPWRVIDLRAKGGRPDALFAYTFTNQEGFRTASHAARIWRDTWDRSFAGRIDRWVMYTVHVPVADRALLDRITTMAGRLMK